MTIDEIIKWFASKRSANQGADDAISFLASAHPRTIFLKTLAPDADVLHLGAEFGSIDVFRRWPPPAREDLRLFAYVNSSDAGLGGYHQIETGPFAHPNNAFLNMHFGAVVCSMVLQRLDDPAPLVHWMAERTKSGSRLFLEWPSPFAALLPRASELRRANMELMVSNFADDASNVQIHERSRVVSLLSKAQFFIESQGYLSLPFLENEVLAHHARGLKDGYALQTAFWSKTRWIQYLVAVRQ
jgi:hypothetical protein